MRTGVLNSKTMYSRNTLPRLVLEKTEKEKRIEEMELEKEKWEEKRKRDAWLNRTGGGMREDERVKETDQEKIQRMNEETWIAEQERKEKGKKRDNHHNREELFLEEERKQHPKKRRRKERGWRKEENHSWGLEVGRREENESTEILAWLRGEEHVTTTSEEKCDEKEDLLAVTFVRERITAGISPSPTGCTEGLAEKPEVQDKPPDPTTNLTSQNNGTKEIKNNITNHRISSPGLSELLGGGVGHSPWDDGALGLARGAARASGKTPNNCILREGPEAVKKGGEVRRVVEEIEVRNKPDENQKEVGNKVLELATKMGVQLKGKKHPTARRKYKQGARILNQEVELGIQPLIRRFLTDQGGQVAWVGEGGGGCSSSSPRKRTLSECDRLADVESPHKRKRK